MTSKRNKEMSIPKGEDNTQPASKQPQVGDDGTAADDQAPAGAAEDKATKSAAAHTASADDDVLQRAKHTDDVDTGELSGYASDFGASDAVRKRKRHRKKHKRLKIILIVLAVLLVLAGGTAFAVTTLINQGQQNVRKATEEAQVDTAKDAVTYDEGKTVTYNGHKYLLNENIVSVAVIGFDREAPAQEGERAGQSDALMVMALDTQTGKATIISIPRDSMVLVDQYVDGTYIGAQTQQICLQYSYGDGNEFSGEITSKAISRTLYNIPIPYYIAMDLSGIGPLNDAIGGVALTPLQSIPGTGIIEGQDTVLLGSNARRYVQYRDTSVDGSALDRQQRQIQYVKAFASQALGQAKGSAGTLIDLYNVASEYAITNVGTSEFSYLATCLASNGVTDVTMTSLPGTNTQGDEHEEFQLDTAGVYEEVLNVYYQQMD